MRTFFLIGSLTVGATLAVGLSHLSVVARVVLILVAVVGLVCIRWAKKRSERPPLAVAYIVDKESERYTRSDISDFFDALSQAKANSADPFFSQSANQFDRRNSQRGLATDA